MVIIFLPVPMKSYKDMRPLCYPVPTKSFKHMPAPSLCSCGAMAARALKAFARFQQSGMGPSCGFTPQVAEMTKICQPAWTTVESGPVKSTKVFGQSSENRKIDADSTSGIQNIPLYLLSLNFFAGK